MSTIEKISKRRAEILELMPGAADLKGIRKDAADLSWQGDASELRKRLTQAYKRLNGELNRDAEPFDTEALKITSLQKIVRALGTSTGWDRYYETHGEALTADPRLTAGDSSPLTRMERIVRRMIAEVKDDQVELRLIDHVTPHKLYSWADTTLPIMLLDLLTLDHVGEQLDHAAMVTNAMFCAGLEPDDYFWEFIGSANAYFFKIGQEGWQQFAQGLGLDADLMIGRNHRGTMLSAYGQKICNIAPSVEEFKELLGQAGHSAEKIPTAEGVAKGWRDQFMQILEEPKRK